MSNKNFIFVPHPALAGGVSNFYAVAKSYFSKETILVRSNSSITKGKLKPPFNTAILIFGLLKIFFYRPGVVVVNPSLGKTAIIRDGVISLWAKLFGCKTVVFWRGWNPQNETLISKGICKFLWNNSFSKADKHICLSSYIKSVLVDYGVPPNLIVQKTTIVDDAFFRQKPLYKYEKKFVVLFLTRVERYKGIYETLEIFRSLSQDKNIELHIAGDGSEIENLKVKVKRMSIRGVKFLGHLSGERKNDAFLNSNCYLFPSYSEGMPNSVLEAMASGLPVVCSRVGGLNDFFMNEKMGFSFPLPIKTGEYVEAIKKLRYNEGLCKEIKKFNIKYAQTNFMASKVINELELELKNV